MTPRSSPPEEWKGHGVILLVDDDSTVRIVGKAMLEALGFVVLIAEDGIEAVDVYRARSEEILLVVLDLAMPRMGGKEAFTELRKINRDATVVISSGSDEEETIGRFHGQGIAAFITKPYRLTSLRNVLRQVLES